MQGYASDFKPHNFDEFALQTSTIFYPILAVVLCSRSANPGLCLASESDNRRAGFEPGGGSFW
jgi:hypothetical protein